MDYEKAWGKLKQTVQNGIDGKNNPTDKLTLLQVMFVMNSLEEKTSEDQE